MSDVHLDYCKHCGGALQLIDGTNPDEAARTGQWRETYACTRCERQGTLIVDDRAGTTRANGVVAGV